MFDAILEMSSQTSLGAKVTVMALVAASIGGVLSVSAILGGLIMLSSIKKWRSVWCGAALLRSPVRLSALPHSRVSAKT
jgi:hypothetical protein